MLSIFALKDSPGEVASLMSEQGIQLVISASTVQEILCTPDISRRTLICQFIIELLQDEPILAPVPVQIRWSSIDFAEGLDFRLYRTGENWGKWQLANADRVNVTDIGELDKKRKNGDSAWNSMQATGREKIQEEISAKHDPKTAIDIGPSDKWLNIIMGCLVDWFPIKNIVAPEALPMIIGHERQFAEWNPLLRCYIEQFVLAIHRHAIEPPNAASQKGPKWMDYSHGAFAGLVDVFVTNDKRFLRALKQHQQLRPEWNYLILDQSELERILHSKSGFEDTLVHKTIMAFPPRE